MLGHRSLHSSHFVVPGPGRTWLPPARGLCAPLLAAVCTAGCARHDASRPVEDTETSGRISIAAAPDVHPLAAAEITAFRTTFAQATLALRPPESSGQVFGALL